MFLQRFIHASLAIIMLGSLGGGLSACNATDGVGQDISSVAREVKRGLFK